MRWLLTIVGCAALLLCIALVATPSQSPLGFPSRSQPTACLSNLRILDGAKTQLLIEHVRTNGEPVVMTDLAPYLQGAQIVCPAGGEYELGSIGADPVCSLGANPVTWRRDGFF